jgi:hypothetical protein
VASRAAVRIRAPGGSGHRPTDRRQLQTQGAARAQNRQGWSAERPVPVCPGRPRLANVVRAFTESATNKDTASRRSARPSVRGGTQRQGLRQTDPPKLGRRRAGRGKRNPGAATRAGTKKTALFDIVKMDGASSPDRAKSEIRVGATRRHRPRISLPLYADEMRARQRARFRPRARLGAWRERGTHVARGSGHRACGRAGKGASQDAENAAPIAPARSSSSAASTQKWSSMSTSLLK